MQKNVVLIVCGGLSRDQQHEKVRQLAAQGLTPMLFQSYAELEALQALGVFPEMQSQTQ